MKPLVFLLGLTLAGCSAASGTNFSPANDPPQSVGSDVGATAFGFPGDSAIERSARDLAADAKAFSNRSVRRQALDACNNDTFCYGRENKGTGYALEGLALDNAGVYGETTSPSKTQPATAGVVGLDGSTDGGTANAGVAGYGYAVGVLGVGNSNYSQSVGMVGVNLGSGYAANFVNTTAGAVSITGGTGGLGVITERTGGVGIGVVAENGSAVEATSVGGEYAVEAYTSAGEYGVYSVAGQGEAGYFSSNNYTYKTLYADNSATSGSPFEACGTGGCFTVSSSGEGSHTLPSRDSRPKLVAFSAEASRAQIEDVGYGHITSGRGFIGFDNALKRAIDLRAGYHVFLTADGDNRGLFVASKTPEGFAVREAQGGKSTLDFEYRIVGSPVDEGSERFPTALPVSLPPHKTTRSVSFGRH